MGYCGYRGDALYDQARLLIRQKDMLMPKLQTYHCRNDEGIVEAQPA